MEALAEDNNGSCCPDPAKHGDNVEAEEFSLVAMLASRWKQLMIGDCVADSDSGERVRVIHHDGTSLGVQLLRFDVERLREMEKLLEEYSRKAEPFQPGQLREEALVAAQRIDTVVRGVVCTVIGETARVYLLDYGITETLRIDQLRDLPKEMVTQVPIYGVRVLLDKEGSSLVEDGSPILDEDMDLMNRIVRLGSLAPRSLTTARARLLFIETDLGDEPLEAVLSRQFSIQTLLDPLKSDLDESTESSIMADDTVGSDRVEELKSAETGDDAPKLRCHKGIQTMFDDLDALSMQGPTQKGCHIVRDNQAEKENAGDPKASTTALDIHRQRPHERRSSARLQQRQPRRNQGRSLDDRRNASKQTRERPRKSRSSTASTDRVEALSSAGNSAEGTTATRARLLNKRRTLTRSETRSEINDVSAKNDSNAERNLPSREVRSLQQRRPLREAIMKVKVKFYRKTSRTSGVAVCLPLLRDVEKALQSLTAPPVPMSPKRIYWGARVLLRRSQVLYRATIDWRASRDSWWHCIFDDCDSHPMAVRASQLLECPSSVICLPRALVYVYCPDQRNVFPIPGQMGTLHVIHYSEVRGPVTGLPMNKMIGYFHDDDPPSQATNHQIASTPTASTSTTTEAARIEAQASARVCDKALKSPRSRFVDEHGSNAKGKRH